MKHSDTRLQERGLPPSWPTASREPAQKNCTWTAILCHTLRCTRNKEAIFKKLFLSKEKNSFSSIAANLFRYLLLHLFLQLKKKKKEKKKKE